MQSLNPAAIASFSEEWAARRLQRFISGEICRFCITRTEIYRVSQVVTWILQRWPISSCGFLCSVLSAFLLWLLKLSSNLVIQAFSIIGLNSGFWSEAEVSARNGGQPLEGILKFEALYPSLPGVCISRVARRKRVCKGCQSMLKRKSKSKSTSRMLARNKKNL